MVSTAPSRLATLLARAVQRHPEHSIPATLDLVSTHQSRPVHPRPDHSRHTWTQFSLLKTLTRECISATNDMEKKLRGNYVISQKQPTAVIRALHVTVMSSCIDHQTLCIHPCIPTTLGSIPEFFAARDGNVQVPQSRSLRPSSVPRR